MFFLSRIVFSTAGCEFSANFVKLFFKSLEVLDRDVIGQPVRDGPDDEHLFLDRPSADTAAA